jgi:hypothetical protein
VVTVLVVGGAVSGFAVSFHYLHAPGLESGGSFGWLPPDNRAARFVPVGPYSGIVTPPRLNQPQTFAVDVYNPAPVTQTIMGLSYSTKHTAEPESLSVSTVSTAVGDAMTVPYTSSPVAVPPHGIRTVRLTRHTAGCDTWGGGAGRSESYTELDLKVRVGIVTRTEVIDFGGEVLEIRSTASTCRYHT